MVASARFARTDTGTAAASLPPRLASALEIAREQERARIARELHDELGQVLTSLKLESMWLVDRICDSEPKPDLQFINKLQSLIGLIEIGIASVRRISGDLRPALLEHLGLAAAAEWEGTTFQARTGIRCRVTCRLPDRALDRDRAIVVFRILQEALTNVARHAHAGAVHIDLRARGGMLYLRVKDNGRGITRAEASSPGALGLLGMRERARVAGGAVTVTGLRGRGTTVSLRVALADSPPPRRRASP